WRSGPMTSMISLSQALVVCTVLSKTSSPVALIPFPSRRAGGRCPGPVTGSRACVQKYTRKSCLTIDRRQFAHLNSSPIAAQSLDAPRVELTTIKAAVLEPAYLARHYQVWDQLRGRAPEERRCSSIACGCSACLGLTFTSTPPGSLSRCSSRGVWRLASSPASSLG